MAIPTSGETFAKLLEHLRYAQEDTAMLAHLEADNNRLQSQGWLAVSELIKRLIIQVTKLAMKKAH